MSISVDINEDKSIIGFLDEMSKIDSSAKFRQALLNAAVDAEEFVKEQLQEMVYDTPPSPTYDRTRRLIRSTQASKRITKEKGALATGVKSAAYYAKYVEFGTESATGATLMPPRPYMAKGLEKASERIMKTLSEGF